MPKHELMPIMHQYFLNEVDELMEDFGFDEQTARKLAHQFMLEAGDIDSNSPDEFINTPIPGCNHCNRELN